MESKLKTKTPLNSTQAIQCRRLLQHLHETAEDNEDAKPIPVAELAKARQVLLEIEPHERSENHVDLVEALYTVLLSNKYPAKHSTTVRWAHLVQGMAKYGAAIAAMELVMSKWNDAKFAESIKGEELVYAVAEGLAREGHEDKLVELINFANDSSFPYDANLQEIITTFLARQDRIKETQQWFDRSIPQKNPRANTVYEIASFARRNNLQQWALPILEKSAQSKLRRRYWETLLQGFLLLGKTIEDVKVIMMNMTGPDGALLPNSSTINCLLRAAMEMKDMRLAEQISALSTELKIDPDGETFLILWHFQLQNGNLEAAERPYEQVQYLEPWESDMKPELDREYEQVLNKYLTTLSQQSPPNFPFLIKIVQSVEEQSARLEPSTVAALCLRFLENDQHFDVMDILSVHAFFFSAEEREVVQTAFLNFSHDPKVSTARAWGGYQILQQFFQDLSFENRVSLIEEFLRRKRSDMAGLVFSHMRAHRNKEYHPQSETYVRILEGISQYPNVETLSTVHNMLKMDTRIQPDTKLLTALMLAYAGCNKPISALDFWVDITKSRNGPSYSSLEAVFWTLEKKSRGFVKAEEIWDKLVRMDVEVNPAVYNAYVGAVAAGGEVTTVAKLINDMSSVVGSSPDTMT